MEPFIVCKNILTSEAAGGDSQRSRKDDLGVNLASFGKPYDPGASPSAHLITSHNDS